MSGHFRRPLFFLSHPTNLQLTTTRIEIYCRLSEFLLFANDKYLDNPYHNALHGADVCQAMHYFLSKCGNSATNAASLLQPWQVMVALVAALCHDIGHGGVNNAFLEKTNHPLALTYSYTSTLERMHCAEVSNDYRCNPKSGRRTHNTN